MWATNYLTQVANHLRDTVFFHWHNEQRFLWSVHWCTHEGSLLCCLLWVSSMWRIHYYIFTIWCLCGLSRADISFNNVAEASVTQMRICLKASKTDPFRQGTVIKLFKIQGHTCPVTTSIAFLHQRDCNSRLHPYSSPLFAMPNGEPLTRKSFINMLNQLCMASGLNPNLYSGHSLRIGAATSAAKRAVADHLIQVLGRWKSDCYKVYIRTSNETLHSAHIAMSRA